MNVAASLAAVLQGFRARPAFAGLVRVFAVKAAGSALSLIMMTLAARAMGPLAFGQLTMTFAVLSFLAIVVVFGQESLLVSAWGEHAAAGRYDLARQALRRSSKVVAVIAGAASLAVAQSAWILAGPWLALSAGCFLLTTAALVYMTHVARAVVGIGHSDGYAEVTWRSVVSCAAGASLLAGVSFSQAAFLASASLGATLCVGLQAHAVRRALRDLPSGEASAGTDRRVWLSRSVPLWLGGGLEAASQYIDVLLIGLVLSPLEAGVYFAATRIANIFGVISSALHIVGTREIVRSYFGSERAVCARPSGP
jgi:O-antigen/teichoic acid export membrane protein